MSNGLSFGNVIEHGRGPSVYNRTLVPRNSVVQRYPEGRIHARWLSKMRIDGSGTADVAVPPCGFR